MNVRRILTVSSIALVFVLVSLFSFQVKHLGSFVNPKAQVTMPSIHLATDQVTSCQQSEPTSHFDSYQLSAGTPASAIRCDTTCAEAGGAWHCMSMCCGSFGCTMGTSG